MSPQWVLECQSQCSGLSNDKVKYKCARHLARWTTRPSDIANDMWYNNGPLTDDTTVGIQFFPPGNSLTYTASPTWNLWSWDVSSNFFTSCFCHPSVESLGFSRSSRGMRDSSKQQLWRGIQYHVAEWGVSLYQNKNLESWVSIELHVCNFFIAPLNTCSACSAKPLLAGWYGDFLTCPIPLLLRNDLNSQLENWAP